VIIDVMYEMYILRIDCNCKYTANLLNTFYKTRDIKLIELILIPIVEFIN